MREVAQAAAVSVSTVANVLNNPALVAADTRQRVEEAMALVGFVRSGPARQLRGLPSPIVGVVTPDQANPFYALINRGVEDRLTEAGCMLVASSTDIDLARETHALRVLEEQAVRGVIIAPANPDLDQLTKISERGTPIVLLDCPRGPHDLCAVAVDHSYGGKLAVEHLLGLGHRRLAYLLSSTVIAPVAERYAGARQAVVSAGLDPDEGLVTATVEPSTLPEGAEAAVAELLARPNRPTAILCFNDLAALGTIRALHHAGLRVPEDISVIGYDDLQFTGQIRPALTSVSVPINQLGQAAAELLLDEGRRGHQHREIRYLPKLIVRESTAAPNTNDSRSPELAEAPWRTEVP